MTKCDHVNIENMKKAVQALDRAIDADIDEQVLQALESKDVIDIGVIIDKNGKPSLGGCNDWPFDVYACKQDADLIATALNEASLLAVADDPDFSGTLEEQRKVRSEKKYPDYYVVTNTLNGLVDNFTDVDWENIPSLVIGNIQEAKRVLEDAIQHLS